MAQSKNNGHSKKFNIKLLTKTQREAWKQFDECDVLVLLGPAGVGKSYLATAMAVKEIEEGRRSRIILTRPVVEAEESLGFLPGDIMEKVSPYMRPLYDQLTDLVQFNNDESRKAFYKKVEASPLAYMRGRTFKNAVCVLDEAQNCNYPQLKLFLTRFAESTKIVITGDPTQTDVNDSGLMEVIKKIERFHEVAVVEFDKKDNVRHPLVTKFLNVL